MAARVYLDWNATAPMRPAARDAMIAALEVSGNPSSVHAEGRAARALIETAPDRVLWGTDWPHPNVPYMPDDGDLIDLVPLYAPDERHRQLLLVDNPARLFRFPI